MTMVEVTWGEHLELDTKRFMRRNGVDFKHLVAALNAVERGVQNTYNRLDVQAVQKLLGHASLATTQVYAEVSTRRIRLVTDALMPPGDGPPAA